MGGRGWAVPRLPHLGCSEQVCTAGLVPVMSPSNSLCLLSEITCGTWQEALPLTRLSTYGTGIPGRVNCNLWMERHTQT